MSDHLMANYQRLPVSFVRGEGVYLFDEAGNRYLDALSGIAVCGLGYNHPAINNALTQQAKQIWHTSNLFEIPLQAEVAGKLCLVSGMDRAFFCNSGTEANEAAIKLSRLHARKKNIENPIVLSFQGGFHGRTYGSMAATANPKIRSPFEPHLTGFAYLPYNDIEAVQGYVDNANVVAVMIECVQGEGGIHPVDADFLQELRHICDQRDWLLICDEVQIGVMRSGAWFGYQKIGVEPDVITLAKGLGNGIPVGACLAKGVAANYFQPGLHGTTFGGTPLVMAVVNQVLDVYQSADFQNHVNEISDYLLGQLREKLATFDNVKAIRGLGLMIGIELKTAGNDIVSRGFAENIVINLTAGNVVRLLPPLIYEKSHVDELVSKLMRVLEKC